MGGKECPRQATQTGVLGREEARKEQPDLGLALAPSLKNLRMGRRAKAGERRCGGNRP